MYVVGASGTGKSTLLLNLIVQDIKNGEGIAVLDPHGDLIDQILGHIPEERLSDIVLFDPSDEEFPVGFNILAAHSELEKTLLASDLVAVFRRLSTSWGDQMNSVLANAILAFLESEKGGTLFDLRRFLVEKDFRYSFLGTVKDPEVIYYWQKEFPLLKGKPQAPLLTRLNTFLRPKLIRYMVSQKENRLDFGKIMNQGKILLVKLAQGLIGAENAYLLGALLVTKIHQLALGRQEIEESKRRNFYLYIDEFQNFVTPSMADILSGARKYHLALTLAHQELRQLWNQDTGVASAVISNPYTRVCFRLGDFDAQKLKDGFSFFDAKDLQNLGIGEAICRMERAEYDFNLRTFLLPEVEPTLAKQRKERVIASSREKYGRRREEVEADLAKERPAPPTRAPVHKERAEKLVREEKPGTEERQPFVPEPPLEREQVTSQVKRRRRPLVPEPALMGKGGREHKRFQQLVKRLAEDKGYRTIIEKQIAAGAGSVDVSLEKDGTKIACEISITSTPEQELGNIQKCLAAGYERVILFSPENKVLNKAKKFISAKVQTEDLEKVLFLRPEEFLFFLEQEEAKSASKVETVRGYKVKTLYSPLGEEEKESRTKDIFKAIFKRPKS
ncbi:type IV secretion system DNA-binding domain-containing protein [Acidobacteria bacterium AH-259-D05]|nr:type IV secretion system DNA-binding domain-containing protein [Acidobacteria bacterium AH-259-D05]